MPPVRPNDDVVNVGGIDPKVGGEANLRFVSFDPEGDRVVAFVAGLANDVAGFLNPAIHRLADFAGQLFEVLNHMYEGLGVFSKGHSFFSPVVFFDSPCNVFLLVLF